MKYFHPSDEASSIDWDKFAIYGAKKVKDAEDTEELKIALEALFLPIAPTIQIYISGQKPEDPMRYIPGDPNGLKVVAWQHLGLGGSRRPFYMSIRINRKNRIPVGQPSSGVLTQAIDAAQHCGKQIKLKTLAKANVSGSGNLGRLLLRVDRRDAQGNFVDLVGHRPINSRKWRAYEIVGKVAENATRISFDCRLSGAGQVWFDEFQLFVKDKNGRWQAVEIDNPGFEEVDADNKPKGWNIEGKGSTPKVVTGGQYKGDRCLLIEAEQKFRIFSGILFEKHPQIGEVVEKRLAESMFCRIPLALYSDSNNTLGKNERHPFTRLARELDSMPIGELTLADENLRLGDVVIAWNVFQHFYPYFDVVDVNWDLELTHALRKAITDKNEKDFYYTLCKLVAKLQDGHGVILHDRTDLPFRVDWIEDQVVVTASGTKQVNVGDIIVSIDGIRAEQALLDAEEYISGSPQRCRFEALLQFGSGDNGTKVILVINRKEKIYKIQIERGRERRGPEPEKPEVDKLQDDIYYIDLTRAQIKDINKIIHDITKFKGIVFDLRGYPRSQDFVRLLICHLLQKKDTSNAWMRVPQIIYPDQENIVGYKDYGWGLKPKEPRIKGKVVFLTNASAISAAESYLSFVEHYKLGEILGQPTAGANGNVNGFSLPGDFTIFWTGMKVLKHDGSQHHSIGIQPTVPVKRTIQGIIEGRDEYFDKALEIINQHEGP